MDPSRGGGGWRQVSVPAREEARSTHWSSLPIALPAAFKPRAACHSVLQRWLVMTHLPCLFWYQQFLAIPFHVLLISYFTPVGFVVWSSDSLMQNSFEKSNEATTNVTSKAVFSWLWALKCDSMNIRHYRNNCTLLKLFFSIFFPSPLENSVLIEICGGVLLQDPMLNWI